MENITCKNCVLFFGNILCNNKTINSSSKGLNNNKMYMKDFSFLYSMYLYLYFSNVSIFRFVFQRSAWICRKVLYRGRYLGSRRQQYTDLLYQGPSVLPKFHTYAKEKSRDSLEGSFECDYR